MLQVDERHDLKHYLQVEVQPKVNISTQQTNQQAINIEANYSKCFDDDGRLRRTGNSVPIIRRIVYLLMHTIYACISIYVWEKSQTSKRLL